MSEERDTVKPSTVSLSIAEVKTPIDKSETTSETHLQSLRSSEEKTVDAAYSVENEVTNKEATVFEKVKGFLFGKSKKDKTSKATIKTSAEERSPIEISSEPDVISVGNLPKDDVVKDVATDISTRQDVHQLAVSVFYHFKY